MSTRKQADASSQVDQLRKRIAELEQELSDSQSAEQRLLKNEQWLTAHLEQTPVACSTWGLDLRCTEWNPAAERIFGYTREEALGRTAEELIVPQCVEDEVHDIVARLRDTCEPVSNVNLNVTKDGRQILCEWQNTPLVNESGKLFSFVSMAQDITERRRVEQQWKSVLNHLPGFIMMLDADARIRLINRIDSNYTNEPILGMPAYEFVVPEHRRLVIDAVRRVFETGEYVDYEVQDVQNNRWFAARLAPVMQDNQVDSVVCITTDVDDRKKTEHLLRESEFRLRTFSEAVPVVFCLYDPHQNKVLYINEAYKTVFGQTCEELYDDASSWFNVLHPDDRDRAAAWFLSVGENPRTESIDYRVVRPDGTRWIEDRCYTIADENGKVQLLAAVCVDFTEKKQAQEELRRSKAELEKRVQQRTAELAAKNRELIEDIMQRKKVERKLRTSQERLFQERDVLRRMVAIHDRDIQLIAYELHDGIVQDMAGSLMFLEASRHLLADDAPELQQNLESCMRVLRGAVEEARRMVNELRFTVLDEEGVVPAVENLIAELTRERQVEIEFRSETNFRRLAPALETAIYRIIQESLTNVCRHSQSLRAEVSICEAGEQVELRIQDWGVGFDLTSVRQRRYGLTGIKERARLFGGVAEIFSLEGEGTTILVKLPLSDMLSLPNDEGNGPEFPAEPSL